MQTKANRGKKKNCSDYFTYSLPMTAIRDNLPSRSSNRAVIHNVWIRAIPFHPQTINYHPQCEAPHFRIFSIIQRIASRVSCSIKFKHRRKSRRPIIQGNRYTTIRRAYKILNCAPHFRLINRPAFKMRIDYDAYGRLFVTNTR